MTTRNLALIAVVIGGGALVGWLGGSPARLEGGAASASHQEAMVSPAAPAGFGAQRPLPTRIPVTGSDPTEATVEQRAQGLLAREAATAEAQINPPLAIESGTAQTSRPAAVQAPPRAGPAPGGWGNGQPAAEPGGWGAPRPSQ